MEQLISDWKFTIKYMDCNVFFIRQRVVNYTVYIVSLDKADRRSTDGELLCFYRTQKYITGFTDVRPRTLSSGS